MYFISLVYKREHIHLFDMLTHLVHPSFIGANCYAKMESHALRNYCSPPYMASFQALSSLSGLFGG